ncbi:LuxR family transcriptional regulator [Chitinimonas sp. BJB300]|uniref:LuxR family transcriptional regulator n=1 Tax=Chitinimonas sp. BJB300 TaxID=1559339 RepID=UPI000C1156DE|nr:LuxR family transcriptional regulator [Chitinimonas sp. BJB300]PHV13238.1 LuxR family transcriptional regulator [Chitinimonas sp. BJB300]TSJ90168.1 LuxR family transcriptional regulator [Chitinimonas sp. BJB300]
MDDWREVYIDQFASAKSETEVFNQMQRIARELGFEHCAYGMRLPLPVSNQRFFMMSDYPEHWVQRYVENNYFDIDPTVLHGLTETTPLLWSADQPASQAEFWEEARLHKLRHGWCMPAQGKYGLIGLLSLVRSADAITPVERDEKELRMTWLTRLVHGAMSQQLAPQLMPECEAELTTREREVLKWTSTGKTYTEIGLILAIDGRTVKFHLVNAMRKLNSANKTEAAIKASMLGMLF